MFHVQNDDTKNRNIELLKNGLKSLGICVTEDIIKKFNIYAEKIKEWTKKINITSITKEEDIINKHFLDSLCIVKFVDINHKNIVDLGTGIGFPGLPLKIIYPEIFILFIDSSNKKTKVLKNICNALDISNYEILCDNIEKVANDAMIREKFDIAFIRAVSNMSVLIEYGVPFLKKNGKLVLYKGYNVEKEVEKSKNALNKLNAKIIKNVDFNIPFSEIRRRIIIVEKIGITQSIYPRRVGIPKKRPL